MYSMILPLYSQDGMTAMMHAVEHYHTSCLDLLLLHGADKEARDIVRNDFIVP